MLASLKKTAEPVLIVQLKDFQGEKPEYWLLIDKRYQLSENVPQSWRNLSAAKLNYFKAAARDWTLLY